MGASTPTAVVAPVEDATPDFIEPQRWRYTTRYRQICKMNDRWPVALSSALPPQLSNGSHAFIFLHDYSPAANSSLAAVLFKGGYTTR